MVEYTIRPFRQTEWQELKLIRLEALKEEPGNFGASYEKDAALSDTEWEKRISRDDCVYFMLRLDNEVVGMTGVYLVDHDAAKCIASYIRKEHRGKGLSKLLYEARIEWARAQGAKKILVAHRKSNMPSMHANQKFGFSYIGEEDVSWPDGNQEPIVNYELML